MNPSDANSPLATLRQLKEMLDAGTLTPAEFEALKQQLVFGVAAAAPEPPVSSTPAPLPPPAPLAFVPIEEPITASPSSPEVSSVADMPDWLAPTPPLLPTEPPASPGSEAAERRNPLTLVFAVGGALVLLSIILYLVLGRPATPDEHLTSVSQTAADSAAVAPEVGPQAQQITLPPAVPETIRVAPAVPPPVAPALQAQPDSSMAAPAAKAPAPSPAPSAPAKLAAPAKAAPASPAPTDSAATKTEQR